MTFVTWVLVCVVIAAAWAYSRWRHSYWSSRGVSTPPFLPFLGHIHQIFSRNKKWVYDTVVSINNIGYFIVILEIYIYLRSTFLFIYVGITQFVNLESIDFGKNCKQRNLRSVVQLYRCITSITDQDFVDCTNSSHRY